MDFLQELKARSVDGIGGLYVVITQDAKTRDVLMQAFADREAVEKTVETGLAHYYSTSRRKLWLKGESSGNTQKVVEMLVDCDADAIIYLVEQNTAACHKGYRSCFYRKVVNGRLQVFGERMFDPKGVY